MTTDWTFNVLNVFLLSLRCSITENVSSCNGYKRPWLLQLTCSLLWAHFIFIYMYVWVYGPCVKLYCGGPRVFDLKLELQVVGTHWNCLATGNQTFPSHLLSSRAHRAEEEVEITHRIWDLEIYSKVSYEERWVYCLQHAFYTMSMSSDRAANTFNFQSISMVLIYLFVYLLTYSYHCVFQTYLELLCRIGWSGTLNKPLLLLSEC